MKLYRYCWLILLFPAFLQAQKGTIRGMVYDDHTGETLPFVNMKVASLPMGTSTDIDGSFSINLDPGTYTLVFSLLSYTDVKVRDVVVKSGELTAQDVFLSENSELLQEVVISASQVRNTEGALLRIRKRSMNFLDGVSSQNIKKSGDGDAASAIKRVTGVSITGGKYVYVRGLGDRYTKTTLNGLDIPGLDPDKNSVHMDLFPTNILDNIMVYKNATADLSSDFSGGVVNILTKDFPESKELSLGIGLGYNSNTHYNDQFVTYKGGGLDFLGFDNGTRKLPFRSGIVLPDPSEGNKELTRFTSLFNPEMSTQRTSAGLDKSLHFTFGNQYALGSYSLGLLTSAIYKRESAFYKDVVFNTYVKSIDKNDKNLERELTNNADIGTQNAMISIITGISVKNQTNQFGLNFLGIQNGISTASSALQVNSRENPATITRDNLEYVQRTMGNIQLSGKHILSRDKWELEWAVSPTYSRMYEPDIRYTGYEISEEGDYLIQPSVGATVSRTYRDMVEYNIAAKVDMTYRLMSEINFESKLKYGFSGTQKNRNFEILNYFLRVRRPDKFDFIGNPNELFETSNLWTTESGAGTYIKGNFEPANSYEASQSILAAYAMNEFSVKEKFSAIFGIRMELAKNYYTGQNNTGTVIYDSQKVLDNIDWLPSASLIYKLNENFNLRSSFSRTLARPTFKEKSIAQIQDRISGRSFIGNIDLKETNISNYDIRAEHFLENGEIIALSAFYKSFRDPIELVAYSDISPNDFQPRNVDNAKVAGIELEVRKNLGLIKALENLKLGMNFTLVHSKVGMTNEEFQSRVNNAREGEIVSDSREMVGQSPYILNVLMNYNNPENGLDANMSYNVQGKRLHLVGIGRNPDVYDRPFHSLDFKLSKAFGPNKTLRMSLGATNLLNSKLVKDYFAFGENLEEFESRFYGRTIKLSFSIIAL